MKVDAIRKKITSGMVGATADVRDKVADALHENILDFYDDPFDPVYTKRFYQIDEAVFPRNVVRKKNGAEAKVSMLSQRMHHPESYEHVTKKGHTVTIERTWSEHKILQHVLSGDHGGAYQGHEIWDNANNEIKAQYKDWYRDALRANGVPVK